MIALFDWLGTTEFAAIAIIGIMLYGKNLPTVARTVGRTIAEFKRHLRDIEDQIKREAYREERRDPKTPDPAIAKQLENRIEGPVLSDGDWKPPVDHGTNGAAEPPRAAEAAPEQKPTTP